jgi:hypothetical protein
VNIDLIFDEIILGNNTLSKEGREEIIYELIDVYSRMPQPVKGVGVMTFARLNDKELVLTLISAYEADAIRHFLKSGVNPSKIAF